MPDVVARVLALLYLMAPAYCANMAPPFVRFWRGWNRPIHEPWFGAHKTVLGFVAGVFTAVAVTGSQALVAAPFALVPYKNWLLLGLSIGVGAMGGDAAKSFFKRRLGIRPGGRWIPFDQLDFAVGALIVLAPAAHLTGLDIVMILVATFVGDIAVNQLAFRLGIKKDPW